MQWQDYENRVRREWQLLLDSNPPERSIVAFLSEHTSLLCKAVASTAAGSYPMRAMVIVQPPLQAVLRRVPDFLFMGEDSATVYPTFIEIERPNKRWFNAKGYPSQQFTQAVSQLRDWQTWFEVGHNQSVFVEQFDLASLLHGRRLQPWYILVLGRRAEFDEHPELLGRRAVEQKAAEAFMTFDRLTPQQTVDQFITVRRRPRRYECVAVPPTLKMNPHLATCWLGIQRRKEAIQKSSWIAKERRDFLASRVEYWDSWAAREHHGIIHGDDEE